MCLFKEPRVSCLNSSWNVMSHFRINPVAQRGLLWLAAFSSLPAFFFLEAGISKDGMHLHPVPLCLSICQSSLWGSSIHRQPQCFIWALLSSHYRCKCCPGDALPQRERGATQRGWALPARGSLFPGDCACSVWWHGTTSVWRTSRVNSSTYN